MFVQTFYTYNNHKIIQHFNIRMNFLKQNIKKKEIVKIPGPGPTSAHMSTTGPLNLGENKTYTFLEKNKHTPLTFSKKINQYILKENIHHVHIQPNIDIVKSKHHEELKR